MCTVVIRLSNNFLHAFSYLCVCVYVPQFGVDNVLTTVNAHSSFRRLSNLLLSAFFLLCAAVTYLISFHIQFT